MSQLILDEQIDVSRVLVPPRRWITAESLPELRPDEQVLDERVPAILLTLKQPTFVTIDHNFWHRRLCNPNYGILYFALRDDQQEVISELLRALLRRPEFRTRAHRMGKVARISTASIEYWQFQVPEFQRSTWTPVR